MQTITIATAVDMVLDGELERLALATGRTKSEVVADALVSYVAAERQFMDEIDSWEQDVTPHEGRDVPAGECLGRQHGR